MKLGAPPRPSAMLLGGKPLTFACETGDDAVCFEVDTIGEELSIGISSERC